METADEAEQYIDSVPWYPQEGPQEAAYFSEADEILYGGAAGGGKTSLAVGLAITRHLQTLFVRRESTQLGGVYDHIEELIDPGRKGQRGQPPEWNIPPWDGVNRKIVFGSTPNLGDESKYQGRARDLLVIDEAANMLYSQVRFLMGWVRTTVKGQRTRVLLCSNPPTGADGYWIIEMFAPWLDPQHPNRAAPGELRYFTTVDGVDKEMPNGDPVEINGEMVTPKSRTFIPAKVTDNKYLGADYMATLQALPEPLRSQMLYGDFTAGMDDDEYQVIPTEWVRQAQNRWKPMEYTNISSAGLDPSRGGRDDTILSARSGWHFHELEAWPGHEMDTGAKVAGKVIERLGLHDCPIHVDSIGIGASVVDHLEAVISARCVPVNFAGKSSEKDWSGTMSFFNKRAECWWRMRDLLNPSNGQQVRLPPDQKLLADLCAPRYKLMATGIKIEGKEDIVKRLGRSPDRGDAVVMCAERSAIMSISGINRQAFTTKRSF